MRIVKGRGSGDGNRELGRNAGLGRDKVKAPGFWDRAAGVQRC